MHVYFSGIGGSGIGPLALLAKEAGFKVSGSDKQDSKYLEYLRSKGINDIHVGQSEAELSKVHDKDPIDWLVYTSALPLEKPDAPELHFCRVHRIKTSKRDEFTNFFIDQKKLKLIAVAGTHGKTTTTAMIVWLFKQLDIPVSYSVGAKLNFGDMAQYEAGSEYFIYECDEFDRNFLAFEPYLSVITGVSWDHHEIYPTREDYQEAFREFIAQSRRTILWEEDLEYLNLQNQPINLLVQSSDSPLIDVFQLKGRYNRLDAWLALQTVQHLTKASVGKLMPKLNKFPGLSRRMEEIVPGLYSDYAHTPEKIRGAMSTALEMVSNTKKDLVVMYEPLTNRRQHFIKNDYKDCFSGAKVVYWLPSYLAREDPTQVVLRPQDFLSFISDPETIRPAKLDLELKNNIQSHLNNGDMVVGMTGGGGGSLDEWLRKTFLN